MKNKKQIINDENDLLGLIIQKKNDKNICLANDLITIIGKDRRLDLQKYVEKLQSEGYILQVGTNELYVYSEAKKGYVSKTRKIMEKIRPIVTHVLAMCFGLLLDEYFIPLFKTFCSFIKGILR